MKKPLSEDQFIKEAEKRFDEKFTHALWMDVPDRAGGHQKFVVKEIKVFIRELQKEAIAFGRASKGEEIIICSAIKTKVGLIIRGQRHNHILWIMAEDKIDRKDSAQGFMTSQNRFVDRKEAHRIHFGREGELYSEDLY